MAKRGSQRQPTKRAIANYYALLRSAADGGDINAAGWLLVAHQQRSADAIKEISS